MEQQRAINALEPYLALSKNARTATAAADLINQATSDSQTYVFAELLESPNIQSLRESSPQHLALLEIFAWGTWADYKATAGLPDLNDKQTQKLKLLSLISLLSNPATPASATKDNLSYHFLQRHLDVAAQPDLEKLLTSALSSGLIVGHLDPLHKLVAVTSVAPLRDLPPGSAPQLIETLSDWESRCGDTLKDIESRMQQIKDSAKKRSERDKARTAAFEKELETENGDNDDGKDNSKGLRAKRKEPGGRGGEAMDVDDDAAKSSTRSGTSKVKKLFGKGAR